MSYLFLEEGFFGLKIEREFNTKEEALKFWSNKLRLNLSRRKAYKASYVVKALDLAELAKFKEGELKKDE